MLTALLQAQSGTPDAEKLFPGTEATLLQLLELQQLSRGQVLELLSTEPESHGRNKTCLAESSVKQYGRLIHCRDRYFTLQRITE